MTYITLIANNIFLILAQYSQQYWFNIGANIGPIQKCPTMRDIGPTLAANIGQYLSQYWI